MVPGSVVLATAYSDPKKPRGTDKDEAVIWVNSYGKGRVYVSTYGHVWKGDVNPPSLRCAAVQTIIPRAVQWLANRPVTVPVPKDFPGTNAVSVRAVDTH